MNYTVTLQLVNARSTWYLSRYAKFAPATRLYRKEKGVKSALDSLQKRLIRNTRINTLFNLIKLHSLINIRSFKTIRSAKVNYAEAFNYTIIQGFS